MTKPAGPSLRVKLMVSFSLVSVLGIGLAALLSHWVTVREFERFFQEKNRSEFAAAAAAHYRLRGDWTGVREVLRGQPRWVGADRRSPPPNFALVDVGGTVVSPAAPYRLGEHLADGVVLTGQAVLLEGVRIGTVLDGARKPTLSDRERQFLASTDRSLVLAALGSVALALTLAAMLARGLVQPLRNLTQAIRNMASGNPSQELSVRSTDELGELTQAFNQMSRAVARSDAARRQMTADIAHDLRTPLTVISGYLEGLRDGLLQPTPARFEALHTETQHLTRLVEDLRQLSLADAGELSLHAQMVAPSVLLDRLVDAFGPQAMAAGLALTSDCAARLPALCVDLERMVQAMSNLVANALRHTPRGGNVVLSARRDDDGNVLEVWDDGEGIPEDDLSRIFDRSYRSDAARTRVGSESGLGLAIARSIVQAHGGTLVAKSAGRGQGSRFTICLPDAGAPAQSR